MEATDAMSGGRCGFAHRQKTPWETSRVDWARDLFRWSGCVTVTSFWVRFELSRAKKPAEKRKIDGDE
jgi:hypothetical protein